MHTANSLLDVRSASLHLHALVAAVSEVIFSASKSSPSLSTKRQNCQGPTRPKKGNLESWSHILTSYIR